MNANTQRPTKGFEVKWYYFLVYFALWARVALDAFCAFLFFSGRIYVLEGLQAEKVVVAYVRFPGLKTTDMILGSLYIALAIFTAFVWFSLKGFRKRANLFLTIQFALEIALIVARPLSLYLLIPSVGFPFLIIFLVIAYIILIPVNYSYFDRRRSIFIN